MGFISRCQAGSRHDYGLLKMIFPPARQWFEKFTVRVDLGFLGFAKAYRCRQVFLPFKKPKGQQLTTEQRAENTKQAQQRVWVEHSIGGLKRYRILSDRLRMHGNRLYDDVLETCAGLWNFHLFS